MSLPRRGLASLARRGATLRELHGIDEMALFVRMSAVAACVPLLMRLPLPRVSALLVSDVPNTMARRDRVDRLPEILLLAQRAWSPLVRTGCLTRGVTLLWFMRREGVDVELCFGLDASTDKPEGHCWLVRDGQPWLERVDPRPRFAVTYRLPASTP